MIRLSSVAELFDLAPHLLEANFGETTQFSNRLRFRPNREVFQRMEDEGALFVLVAMNEDDVIVGYSATMLFPNASDKDTLHAVNRALYVSPPFRPHGYGDQLRRETEDKAKELGASLMSWGMRPGSPLDPILAHDGYTQQEVIYTREL